MAGLLLLSGCAGLKEEVDPYRLLGKEKKLVVNGLISPQDQVLMVKIDYPRSIVDGDTTDTWSSADYAEIANSVVTLSTSGKTVRLDYDGDSFSISASRLPVIAGNTYQLRIQTPAGKQLAASCVVPYAVKTMRVRFDSVATLQNGTTLKRYFVTSHWTKPAVTPGYYQLAGLFRYTPGCPTCARGAAPASERTNAIQFDDLDETLLENKGAAAAGFDSMPAYLVDQGKSPEQAATGPFRTIYKAATVSVDLFSVDENYFLYQSAAVQQIKTKGNPFAEPVSLPSNISGGLGCFGAYNKSTALVKLL